MPRSRKEHSQRTQKIGGIPSKSMLWYSDEECERQRKNLCTRKKVSGIKDYIFGYVQSKI